MSARVLLCVSLVAAAAVGCRRAPPAPPAPALSVGAILGGDGDAGFERALAPRAFSFPRDHGPHPGFRSEWWYVTGHLAAGARQFGYQLTIFRQALAPGAPARRSPWASRQVYMAHLAVTDVDRGRFVAAERLAREGLDLGGAQAQPFTAWVGPWRMAGPPDGDLFPLRLQAASEGAALDLVLDAGRGPILQGDRGLSVKGPEPGNASYYYSVTRLPTAGRIVVDGEAVEVSGSSWLDREWSTSALGPTLAGWDWLALELSDGRDLMVYRLRRKDGTAAPESRATLIDRDGRTRVFGPDQFAIEPRAHWTSPHTGARYPTRLRLTIAAADLALEVEPLVEDQELVLSVRYWEGAVRARGPGLEGAGYLELTGYVTR